MSTTTPAPVSSRRAFRAPNWLSLSPKTIPTFAAVAIFVVMLAYGGTVNDKFFTYSTFSNLLITNAYLIILAVGMTFVILTGGIDLSVGAVIALSTTLGATMLANWGWNPWIVIVVMIAIGAFFGSVSGVLVQVFNVQPFIATLSIMFLTRGLASMISTVPVRVPDESQFRVLATEWKLIDGPKVNDLIITPNVLIAALVVAAAFFVLHRTRTGRTVYAIGGSESSALLMGLPVVRTKFLVYVISGICSGIAGVVYMSKLGIGQNIIGTGWELNAIAATVIGGTLLTGGAGYVLGSVIGALVLGLLTVLIARNGTIPAEATTIITGGILLVFVLLQRGVGFLKPRTRAHDEDEPAPAERETVSS